MNRTKRGPKQPTTVNRDRLVLAGQKGSVTLRILFSTALKGDQTVSVTAPIASQCLLTSCERNTCVRRAMLIDKIQLLI